MNFEYDKKIVVPKSIPFETTQDGLKYWRHDFPFRKVINYWGSILTEDPSIHLHHFHGFGPDIGDTFLFCFKGLKIGISNMRTDFYANFSHQLPGPRILPIRNEKEKTDIYCINTIGNPVGGQGREFEKKHGPNKDRFDEILSEAQNTPDPYKDLIPEYSFLLNDKKLHSEIDFGPYNNGDFDKFCCKEQQEAALFLIPALFSGFYHFSKLRSSRNWDGWITSAIFSDELISKINRGEYLQCQK